MARPDRRGPGRARRGRRAGPARLLIDFSSAASFFRAAARSLASCAACASSSAMRVWAAARAADSSSACAGQAASWSTRSAERADSRQGDACNVSAETGASGSGRRGLVHAAEARIAPNPMSSEAATAMTVRMRRLRCRHRAHRGALRSAGGECRTALAGRPVAICAGRDDRRVRSRRTSAGGGRCRSRRGCRGATTGPRRRAPGDGSTATPGRQESRVACADCRQQERIQRHRAERDRRAAVGRQARNERAGDADAGIRIEHDADDVDEQERHDEDPQVLVPREDPLRQLPGRLVGRMAQDQAERDLEGQQQECRDPRRSGGQPDPELGLALRCRRHDLVGRVDEDQRDDRAKHQGALGRTAGTGARRDSARRGNGSAGLDGHVLSPMTAGTPTHRESPIEAKEVASGFDPRPVSRWRRRRPRRRRSRPRRRASPTTTQRDRSERCASGSSSAAPTYRKNPAKTASRTPEHLVRDGDDQPEQDAEDRRDRDDRDPALGLAARGAAGGQEADDADAVAEAVDDDDDGDDQAEPAADDEAGRQRDPVEEAVDAHPARPDDADVPVGDVAVVELGGRLVADVDGRQLLDGVEGEEAEGGRDHDLVEVAAQQPGRLGDQVEERGPDPDPGADRDDHPDVADRAQRERSRRRTPRGTPRPRRGTRRPASGVGSA